MYKDFIPPKSLVELEQEIQAAIKIIDLAKVPDDKVLSTIVGMVQISTGINCLDLLDKSYRLAIGEITDAA
jgi:hypothetical protein